jgi:hypothetical protein
LSFKNRMSTAGTDQKNRAAMTAEIAAIPPTTPPAMAPVFKLCLPFAFELVGDGEEVEVGPVEKELGVPDGPMSVPGAISGLSKEVVCETVTRGERQWRGSLPRSSLLDAGPMAKEVESRRESLNRKADSNAV